MYDEPASSFVRRSRRAVTPVIAQVFIVAMTVVSGSFLWAYRPTTPPEPHFVNYVAQGGHTEQTWGDGSDCSNVNGVQSCLTLPAIDLIFTQWTPNVIPVSELTFYMLCNGTVYLQSTLSAMTWVPGAAGTPGSNAPQLGTCGNFVPPAAAFNRLTFFDQLRPGATDLTPGDQIVLFQSFEPPNCPSPKYSGGVLVSCDDDFHGAPSWCFTVQGACTIDLVYNGHPSALATTIPVYGLGT